MRACTDQLRSLVRILAVVLVVASRLEAQEDQSWAERLGIDKLKFTARLDLKLPTASSSRALGTGDPDVGLVGIATYKVGKTSFDSNLGYYAIDSSRADFDNDRWFIGEAVRYELNKDWTVVAEAYGLLPNTRAGFYANWYFSGGLQSSVRENLIVTALIGSAAGHKSPDLTGTFEITLTF